MAFEVEQLYVLCCATGLVFVVKGEGGDRWKTRIGFKELGILQDYPRPVKSVSLHMSHVYTIYTFRLQ